MNDKIEVGEYVRTKKGYIRQFVRRDVDDHILLDIGFEGARYLTKVEEKEDIVKHSKNIINLIGKGDYYNGIPIIHKLKNGRIQLLTGHLLSNEDIKEGDNIVTKEQFSSIEYKV